MTKDTTTLEGHREIDRENAVPPIDPALLKGPSLVAHVTVVHAAPSRGTMGSRADLLPLPPLALPVASPKTPTLLVV